MFFKATIGICRNMWTIILCCLVVMIMWCELQNVQSATPTSKPAQEAAWPQEVRGLVDMLGGSNLTDQKAAHRELVALHRTLVDGLLDECNDPRNPHAKEARHLLRQLKLRTLAAHTIAALPEARRQRLRSLYETSPNILYQALSHDRVQRVKAMRSIPRISPPKGPTEELVWIGLNDSSPSVVLAAVRSIQPGRHTSRHVVERLAYFIAAANHDEWGAVTDIGKKAEGPLLLEAARKLESIGAKGMHVCPVLISLCESDSGYTIVRDALVARTVATLGGRRAIPMLMEHVKYMPGSDNSISVDGITVVVNRARSDQFLMALLRVTGQDIRKYGLVTLPILPDEPKPDLRIYGFKNEKQRFTAIAKFREWWKENSSGPDFHNLKPIVMPVVYSDHKMRRRITELAEIREMARIQMGI